MIQSTGDVGVTSHRDNWCLMHNVPDARVQSLDPMWALVRPSEAIQGRGATRSIIGDSPHS